MLNFNQGSIQHTSNNCQQCGACASVCPRNAISFQTKQNGLKDIIIDKDICIHCAKCVNVCPANRLSTDTSYIETLCNKKYCFAYNEDSVIRHKSSSGGAGKTIIIENLKSGVVDGVYSLRKLDVYPSAIGEFYTRKNIPSYDDLPNSVYHSIMACTEINKAKKVNRMMIVGTSCQLYALEKALRGKYEKLIKVCIFCKQQKHLGCTRFLAKAIGTSIEGDKFKSQYRGEGWPGIVRINDKTLKWEQAAGLPFGRRLWCVPGCNICGDPFGMEIGADISLMDPWGIRRENEFGETLVTVHTEVGENLIKNTRHLVVEEKSYDEIRVALGEADIWRKRATIPYFLGHECSNVVRRAGEVEEKQRKMLECTLEMLPRMPFFFYRLLNKLVPRKRDKILMPNI